jgi:hypothetical protein
MVTALIRGYFRCRSALRRRIRSLGRFLIASGQVERAAGYVALVDRRRGLLLRGFAAGIRLLHDDHRAFWRSAIEEFPGDPRFVRGHIQASLRSGGTVEAEGGLEWLMARRVTSSADAKFVVGLARIDQARGDRWRVRVRIRRFLKSIPGEHDRSVAALRLCRFIYAAFPTHGRMPKGGWRKSFLNMTQHAPIARAAAAMLSRVASSEAALENASGSSYFETDVSPNQCRAFLSMVRTYLSAGKPFSWVRVGDGEAACMPYEPRLAAVARQDARARERIWWGRALDRAEQEWLTPRVAHAIWNADCIGIPTVGRFLRELNLCREDSLTSNLTGRGLRSILYCLDRVGELRDPSRPVPNFSSCHLHQELALWDLYGELLGSGDEVVLISCHPALADWVQDKFKVRIVRNLLLPPDQVTSPVLSERHQGDVGQLPALLQDIAEQMGDAPRNRLVLVGAGYPGKWLIETARSRGGVALDLGSIFDHWLGFRTRSYLDLNSA